MMKFAPISAHRSMPFLRVYKRAHRVGWIGVKSCGDNGQVHPVGVEHARDIVDVVLVDLARIVVLEAVEQVGQAAGDALGLIDHRLVGDLVVVARRHEARNRRAESPDPDGVLDHIHERCSFLVSGTAPYPESAALRGPR